MNHIMYLCEVEHREPKLHIAASYYMKGNHLKNWLEKSDFKFNLELQGDKTLHRGLQFCMEGYNSAGGYNSAWRDTILQGRIQFCIVCYNSAWRDTILQGDTILHGGIQFSRKGVEQRSKGTRIQF